MVRLVVIVAAAIAAGASAMWSQPAGGRPARPDPAPVREAMKTLEHWVGEWTGTAWFDAGGHRMETAMVERIQWKLDGSALLVEGVGRASGGPADGRVVHNALAVLSYDPGAKKYRFHHWRESGEHGESELRIGEDDVTWETPGPQGVARFTVTIKDGRWHEVGEASGDGGKTWFKFMEMNLERKGG